MTKKEALEEINQTQDFYVEKLISIINGIDKRFETLKEIDFTSPTGTGKTIMVAKLVKKLPDDFFVITSLSKGQLRFQIEKKLKSLVANDNFIVFGLNELTKKTILKEADIVDILPKNRRIIWIRDEGHIATNRWQKVLKNRASHIVNLSATNKTNNGVQCNFCHTMMLRTVSQTMGTPEEALDKLIEVKKVHACVANYNPCALFRVIHDENLPRIISSCEERGLSYINITDENYDMSDLCLDGNKYDVIINKLKITEGIDLKRCHVIYMDSRPSNESTVVQVIGRARRNALFWRNDIDIMSRANTNLLEQTRKCYVFYNVEKTEVGQNELGELTYSLCDTVSVEALKSGIDVYVNNGQLSNGLHIIELKGKTGKFHINFDSDLKVNIVNNKDFYETQSTEFNPYVIDMSKHGFNVQKIYVKPSIVDLFAKYYPGGHDIRKELFYLYKRLAKKHVSATNVNYWEDFLEINNKSKQTESGKWLMFITQTDFRSLTDNHFSELSNEERIEAKRFSYLKDKTTHLEKINIFKKFSSDSYVSLDYDFLKYVEKIECFNTSIADGIADAISTVHNVRQISSNRYLYSIHPLTDFLKEKGLIDLPSLKHFVFSCNKKTFYGCSIEYWKNMLFKIREFEQIDYYDSKYVSLKELNILCKFGFGENSIRNYIRGKYPLVTKKTVNYICKMNYETMLCNWSEKSSYYIYKNDFYNTFQPYTKIINDYEIASIGPDLMKYSNHRYVEDEPVTSKIVKYCKFNRFLTEKYSDVLERIKSEYFKEKNSFGFDKKCNSCLGFCVEYYAKIKIYGEDDFKPFINEARKQVKKNGSDDSEIIRVRAAMIAYREEMKRCYGPTLAGIIPSISVESLIDAKYSLFVAKVVELGNKTADFVASKLYDGNFEHYKKRFDPNLSVNHISALCDFLNEDTIIDLKCTSSINEQHIKQVLAYHYLSTKRSDLRIKKLIIYDAPTDRSIEIHLASNN